MREWESLSNDISVHGYTPPKVTNNRLRKERDEALTELAEQRKKNASTTSLRQQRDRARSDGEIYRTDLLKLADKVVALRAQLAEAEVDRDNAQSYVRDLSDQLAEAEKVIEAVEQYEHPTDGWDYVHHMRVMRTELARYREKHPKDKA